MTYNRKLELLLSAQQFISFENNFNHKCIPQYAKSSGIGHWNKLKKKYLDHIK